ncbi:MAG TPA: NADH-quinone oxidoreductase subunit NuoH [Bacillota bacterium]|jgi:NADH-quinone oxidoreductase subunit H
MAAVSGAWSAFVDWYYALPPIILVPVAGLLKVLAVFGFIVLNVLILIWLERKLSGKIQSRLGPMRVGRPHGWAQTIADTIKLLVKEDIIPRGVDRWLWVLAPAVVFTPALMVWVVIPFSQNWIVSDINVALIYVAAVSSLAILGIFMSGWGSNNKWSLYGAMRAAAQLISYEVPAVLSLVGVAMIAGSLSLQGIVAAQHRVWFIFLQPLGFIIFLISTMAELNRTPFDLTEAESELVAGFNTEYSGLRWAFFFLGEYANLLAASAIAATVFLGGWSGPFLPGIVWFILKTYFFVILIMWIKWTMPRIRIDQLMDVGWKFLIPLSLANIALTGLVLLVV